MVVKHASIMLIAQKDSQCDTFHYAHSDVPTYFTTCQRVYKLCRPSILVMTATISSTLFFLLYLCTLARGNCPAYTNLVNFWRLINICPADSLGEIGSNLATVHIAVVACGDRLTETLVMIKSAVIFGHAPLHVHIFAEQQLKQEFEDKLSSTFDLMNTLRPFSYSIYDIHFPRGNAEGWKRLFKTCACQRLFIPDILLHVDSALYVDTDILFMSPPEQIWSHFSRFNNTQLAGMSPESEGPSANWYVRFARHPFYPPYGLNSGVMLMNMSRMREFGWGARMQPLYDKYRKNTTWGDQDIINILVQRYPNLVYTFGCEWNYRPDHCMYMQNCRKADTTGVYILHGSRGWFHNDKKQPVFKSIYQSFLNLTLRGEFRKKLLDNLEINMKPHSTTRCGQSSSIFTKRLGRYVT